MTTATPHLGKEHGPKDLSPREQAHRDYAELFRITEGKKHEQKAALRLLGRQDLFFLLVYLLNRADADRDWLFDRCREVQAHPDGYIDLWFREGYKALPVGEPVPTPSGWAAHGELVPGDVLFGPDGKTCRVIAKTPVFRTSECYEIEFDDGTIMRAGADHLWKVERRTRRRIKGTWKKEGARKGGAGGKRVYREPAVISTREIAAHGATPDRRLAIRVNEPLQLPRRTLPVDPYLLGVWLGDGSRGSTRITSGFQDADEMEGLLKKCGYAVSRTKHSKSVSLRIGSGRRGDRTSSDFASALTYLGVYKNKRIPDVYLRASAEQRLGLLRGLLDTDGHCNTRGRADFTTTSDALARGTFELASSLGFMPCMARYTMTVNGKPYDFWRLTFQTRKDMPPFLLARKAVRCKDLKRPRRHFIVRCTPIPSEPVSCIQVDRADGMYLAGRAMIPTHNSTIISFALTIQDILRDPEITVGIFSRTKDMAVKLLMQIKQEFEGNRALRDLYPDVLWDTPEKESPAWSLGDGITVRRKGNPKECTVEAWGVIEGQPTGRHFQLVVYDDMIDQTAVTTENMIKQVTSAWEISISLGADGGRTRYIGTRYHHADTYKTIMDRGVAIPRIYPATHNGEEDGEPVLLSKKTLEKRRQSMSASNFAAQYLIDPSKGGTRRFDVEWLRYWRRETTRGLNLYLLVDPANEKRKRSDYTTMMVIGLGRDENYYWVDGVRDKLDLGQRTNALFQLVEMYRPIRTGYEQYGLQTDIDHIKAEQTRHNFRFEIQQLGGNVSKTDRVERLIPVFRTNRFYLPYTLMRPNAEGHSVDLVQEFVNFEYMQWPVPSHDDMLDCASRILDQDMRTAWPQGAGANAPLEAGDMAHADADYDVLGR